MATNYAKMADFLTIYIEEAHPNEGWSFKSNSFPMSYHKSIDERLAAANVLRESMEFIPGALAVDCMTDDANKAYGGLYERLYVVKDGRVLYQGKRGPLGYSLKEVDQWLLAYSQCAMQKAR